MELEKAEINISCSGRKALSKEFGLRREWREGGRVSMLMVRSGIKDEKKQGLKV